MTPARRQLLLFSMLAASAAAVAWDRLRPAPSAVSGAVVRAPAPAAAPRAADTVATTTSPIADLRPRTDYLADGGDAFPALNPPPPPAPPATAAAPVEPPRPTAPAIPFTVIGKKLEAGTWEIYLAKGDQTYVVRQGDVVANDYRVSAITPTHMTLVFLPLNEPQLLQTGATLQ